MRLYFTEFSPSAGFGGVRPLQFLAALGAAVIASGMTFLYRAPASRAALWWGLIVLSEAAIVAINGLYRLSPPDDSRLRAWALAKSALAGLGGLIWSLSLVLLRVDGEPVTTIVPAWMILTFCCGAVWAGAFYVPALMAMLLGAILPGAFWLLTHEGFDRSIGLCMLVSAPMMVAIGNQAAKRYRSAVNDKIEIGLLLARQHAYTQRIEQLNDERRRFFSAASHDLRQPLHAMGLYLSLLGDDANAAQRPQLIDSLSQCAFSLDRQFNAIIGVDETDRFVAQAQPAPTPLQVVLDRVAAQARPRAEAQELRFLVPRTSLWIEAPAEILERVLGNLVHNAIRYTRSGGVLLGARRKGDRVEICVVDTGVGIAREHQETVFRDFFQVDNPGRDRDKGFGLGLGIVRRLCDGMNWPIALRSEPGRGTAFAVSVPRTEAQAASEEAASVEPAAPSPSARRAALIVDDDPLVLDAMRRTLERWGVDARLCRTSQEALAALAAAPPDSTWMALVDRRLGETDGFALAAEIARQCGDRARIAIVTGDVDEDLDARAAAAGFDIVQKPVAPVRVRALLTG